MKIHPTSLLTVLVSLVWLVSFVVRLLNPTMSFGPAFDTAMLLVLGYWFSTSEMKPRPRKENGHGGA